MQYKDFISAAVSDARNSVRTLSLACFRARLTILFATMAVFLLSQAQAAVLGKVTPWGGEGYGAGTMPGRSIHTVGPGAGSHRSLALFVASSSPTSSDLPLLPFDQLDLLAVLVALLVCASLGALDGRFSRGSEEN